MVNYDNSKIYILKCNKTEDYIIGGTTKKYLSQRLTGYKTMYKEFLSGNNSAYNNAFNVLKNDDYDIYLIENFKCNNKEELEARIQYHRRQLKKSDTQHKESKLNDIKKNKILETYLINYWKNSK
jgi:hypothetical protein